MPRRPQRRQNRSQAQEKEGAPNRASREPPQKAAPGSIQALDYKPRRTMDGDRRHSGGGYCWSGSLGSAYVLR